MPAVANPFGFPNDPYPRPYGDQWNFPSGPFSGYDWLGLALMENTPGAAYQRHLSRFPGGRDFTSPFFSFAQAQQPEYYNDYLATAARPNNLGLTWLEYLEGAPSLGDTWGGRSPSQRGESSGRSARPAVIQYPR